MFQPFRFRTRRRCRVHDVLRDGKSTEGTQQVPWPRPRPLDDWHFFVDTFDSQKSEERMRIAKFPPFIYYVVAAHQNKSEEKVAQGNAFIWWENMSMDACIMSGFNIVPFIYYVDATHQNGSEEKVVFRRKLIQLMGKYVHGCMYHVHHAVLQQEWNPICNNVQPKNRFPVTKSGFSLMTGSLEWLVVILKHAQTGWYDMSIRLINYCVAPPFACAIGVLKRVMKNSEFNNSSHHPAQSPHLPGTCLPPWNSKIQWSNRHQQFPGTFKPSKVNAPFCNQIAKLWPNIPTTTWLTGRKQVAARRSHVFLGRSCESWIEVGEFVHKHLKTLHTNTPTAHRCWHSLGETASF